MHSELIKKLLLVGSYLLPGTIRAEKIDENEIVKMKIKNLFSKKLINVFPQTIDAHPHNHTG